MRAWLVLALLGLAGCGREAAPPGRGDTPGDRLERAAVAAGAVVPDGAREPLGVYARESDRVCVVPAGSGKRLGATTAFSDGQACSASGPAVLKDGALEARFAPGCTISIKVEGDRLVFPAEVPAACDALCTGRATLAALDVAQLSDSLSEASALSDPRGRPLCAS